MRNSAIKTFHFGLDFIEALEDVLEEQLVLTALVEALRAYVPDGHAIKHQAARDVKRADYAMVRMIKKMPNLT